MKALSNLRNLFTPLFAVLVLAFAAASPVEAAAKSNPLELFKAETPVSPFDTCNVTGYIVDGSSNPQANRIVQLSNDGGSSWGTFGLTDSNGYYNGDLPATGMTNWKIRVLRNYKSEEITISNGSQIGAYEWQGYCSTAGEDFTLNWLKSS